jgi:hypothetical protein
MDVWSSCALLRAKELEVACMRGEERTGEERTVEEGRRNEYDSHFPFENHFLYINGHSK